MSNTVPTTPLHQQLNVCPVCETVSRIVFTIGEFPIRECPCCQHRFVGLLFDCTHTAGTYTDDYFEGGGVGYLDYAAEQALVTDHGQRYGKLINDLVHPGTLLDVGAAAGFIMDGFEKEGWETRGVEPNATMASIANQRRDRVTIGTLERFDCDEQFDLVSMIQVIPHFHNFRQAFARAAALTKPGGHWLVETWNHRSLTARAFRRFWHEYSPPTVLNWFCPKSLDLAAANAGMELVRSGRPAKYIQGQHAKSLLSHVLRRSAFTRPLTLPLKIVPDRLRIRYPAEDLLWSVYQKIE